MKFEDNPSPYLTEVEQGSTPASPSAGSQKIFIDSASHHVKRVNSSGTVVDLESGAGGFTQGCRVYNSTTQAIPTGTFTALTFDSETFDTDTMHSTSTNTSRVTINTTGTYTVHGDFAWRADAGGARRIVIIRLNGTTTIAQAEQPSDANSYVTMSLSTVYQFTAGDYIELVGYHDKGTNLDAYADAGYKNSLAVWRVG